MILDNVQPDIEEVIPVEQTGLREYRGREEQVLAFTTLIESGIPDFQNSKGNLKPV